MDLEAIANSPVGRLVPISGTDPWRGERYEHQAFMPHPLPRDPNALGLTAGTWRIVVAAANSLGRLDQAGRQVPSPDLLRRPTLRREAQSTSALEGTYAAFTDLFEADLDERRAGRSAEVREVLHYVRAAERAFDWIVDRPLTLGFLGQLQRELVMGTPGDLCDAGGVRDRQVVIGAHRLPVTEARFVPPPPGDGLQAGLDDWLDWVNADLPIPEVVRTALAHYQFETLHPYSDGNGRLGRLVVVLQLMQYGVLNYPLLIVSPWFEARRRAYQDHLLSTSQTGDFNSWVAFFAEGLRAQAEETLRRIEALLDYHDELQAQIREKQIRGVRARIMDDLIAQPVVSVAWAKAEYGVYCQAANEAIARLVRQGVLHELTGRTYGRVFAARRVLSIIE